MGHLRDFAPVALTGAAGTAGGLECPRCGGVGIERIDPTLLKAIPVADLSPLPEFLIPSVPVRCPACSLAGDRWGFLPAA